MTGILKEITTTHAIEPGRRLSYLEFGSNNEDVILCVHALTYNAHDFDHVASALADSGYRVISVDMAGRGQSDYLQDAKNYDYPLYIADTLCLLETLGINQTGFIGSSMGGLIAIFLSAMKPNLIDKIVLNDIGPSISAEAMKFICVDLPLRYESEVLSAEEAMALAKQKAHILDLDESYAEEFLQHDTKEIAPGEYVVNFDRRIFDYFKAVDYDQDVAVWDIWGSVKAEVLLIWGEKSIFIDQDLVNQMRSAHKNFTAYECLRGAHICNLMESQQIDAIVSWFQGEEGSAVDMVIE